MRSFLFALFILTACQPPTMLQQGRWNGEGKRPELEATGLVKEKSFSVMGEDIEFSQQKIDQYPVEEAYRKVIYKDKNPIFESYSLIQEKKQRKILRQADTLSSQKDLLWPLFLKAHPQYQQMKEEKAPQVLIAKEGETMRALLCGQMQDKQGLLIEVCTSHRLKVLRERVLGSGLDSLQASTLIFPKGPKYSELSKAVVPRIVVDYGLKNSLVEVNTEGPEKILASSALEIQPQDERFDQTQAFFFANQLLSWLQKKQILIDPLAIKITTQMGYPDKTNTAFYYGGRIRLGTGDDVTYSRIPWDPSIVMHEVAHAVIEKISRLPFEGEGGSINEGYADLFSSFLLNNPKMAENSYKPADFRRRADEVVKLSEKNGGLYHDAAIVSGLFWSLKTLFPEDKVLQYAVKVLNRLGPDANFENFSLALREQKAAIFTEEELQKLNPVLKERELE